MTNVRDKLKNIDSKITNKLVAISLGKEIGPDILAINGKVKDTSIIVCCCDIMPFINDRQREILGDEYVEKRIGTHYLECYHKIPDFLAGEELPSICSEKKITVNANKASCWKDNKCFWYIGHSDNDAICKLLIVLGLSDGNLSETDLCE